METIPLPSENDYWMCYMECSICEKSITQEQLDNGDAVIKTHLCDEGRRYFDLRHGGCYSMMQAMWERLEK
jgi:hypothetical protein